MNQVWNIFRKDVRHHWPWIAASLVLVVGFVSAEMGESSRPYGVGALFFGLANGLAVPLLPISWMFLIVRAVQDESLAGDRQFWVTRPYDWKKLLLAKVLFVIAFINIPLAVAHIFLVYKAGFHPAHYVAGLLWLQLLWTFMLLLPTAALTTVTRNIGQMLLGLIFVGVFAIGFSTLSEAVPDSGFSGSVAAVDFSLILISAAAVILLQYSLRRTTQSRSVLGGLAAALILVLVATPYRMLIARTYPLARTEFPLQLSIINAHSEIHYDLLGRVPVPIQLSLSGLPKDSFVEFNGYILTLRNTSGQHWDSGWEGRGGMFFSDDKLLTPNIEISKDVLDKLSSSPMSGDLLLAFTLYHDRNQRPLVVPRGEFFLADLGFCSSGPSNSSGGLYCRIALRRPEFLMVSSEMAASTCPLAKDQLPPQPGELVRTFVRGGSEPAEPGLSPIVTEGITFSQASTNRVSGICPGTPLTLSNPENAGRSRVEVHIDHTWFDAYLQALNKNKAP